MVACVHALCDVMSHTYEVAGAFLGEIPGMINYATEMKIIYEHFGLDEVRSLIGRGAGPGASSLVCRSKFLPAVGFSALRLRALYDSFPSNL